MQTIAVRALRGLWIALAIVLAGHNASAAPFDDCQDHLPFGIPTLTREAPTTPICHVGYAVLHDDKFLVPRWVAYRLTGEHTLGCFDRTDNFHPDENLPANRRATPDDYKEPNFDQGHQAPAQDFAWNLDRMKDSFSMANMTPQLAGFNRAQWLRLEESVRVWATDRSVLIVYVGPLLVNTSHTIGANKVVVPIGFWKVIVDPNKAEAIAFVLPHRNIPKGKLEPFQTSIRQIEDTAGIRLPLPPGVDREATPALWPADLSAWAKKHKLACPAVAATKKATTKKAAAKKKAVIKKKASIKKKATVKKKAAIKKKAKVKAKARKKKK